MSALPVDMVYHGAVLDEWLDGLGHMNMRFYLHAFTDAADSGFERFFYSAEALATRRSAVTAELHLVYRSDAKRGERFSVTTWIAEIGDKKLRLYQEMRSADGIRLIATVEQMWLHVDLENSKVIAFEAAIKQQFISMQAQASPIPAENFMGRAVGVR